MKSQCRKAECMRKTKLIVHYIIYKDRIHAFNMEQGKARQTFFWNIINSNLNYTSTFFYCRETDKPKSQSQRDAFRKQVQ